MNNKQSAKVGEASPGNGNINYERMQYYYHSDHLGSSSYITNLDGAVVQHVEYVPFGEVFIEERNNTWNTPYLFNGKELDEETGLYYYGARYFNPRESVWLSVDPLAGYNPIMETEHYIDGQHNGGVYNSFNHNTYGYCYQNPVYYIDPDGKQVVAPPIAPPITAYPGGYTGTNRLKGVTIKGLYKEAVDFIDKNTPITVKVAKVVITASVTKGVNTIVNWITGDDDSTKNESTSTTESTSTSASPAPNDDPNKKGGGKNSQHANQKARQSAADQYEKKKSELNQLRSKPNKTPEDKINMIKLENQVKQLQQKKDFTGENHSRNAKGIRK